MWSFLSFNKDDDDGDDSCGLPRLSFLRLFDQVMDDSGFLLSNV